MKSIYTLILALVLAFGFSITTNAQIGVIGSRSGQWFELPAVSHVGSQTISQPVTYFDGTSPYWGSINPIFFTYGYGTYPYPEFLSPQVSGQAYYWGLKKGKSIVQDPKLILTGVTSVQYLGGISRNGFTVGDGENVWFESPILEYQGEGYSYDYVIKPPLGGIYEYEVPTDVSVVLSFQSRSSGPIKTMRNPQIAVIFSPEFNGYVVAINDGDGSYASIYLLVK